MALLAPAANSHGDLAPIGPTCPQVSAESYRWPPTGSARELG